MNGSVVAPITWQEVEPPSGSGVPALVSPAARIGQAARTLDFALGRRSGGEQRMSPSAGACYPYELFIWPAGETSLGMVDLVRRRIVSSDPQHGWRDSQTEFALVGRPWLSVRKYGRRGYLYHLLDSGHALVNLGLVAEPLSAEPEYVPALARSGRLLRHVDDFGGAVLGTGRLSDAIRGSGQERTGWTVQVSDAASQPRPSDLERLTRGIFPPAMEPVQASVDANPEELAVLRGAIARRRSATTLGPEVDSSTVRLLVERASRLWGKTLARMNLPEPEVTILSRDPSVGGELPRRDRLEAALLAQAHVADAHSFLVVRAEIPDKGSVVTPRAQRWLVASGAIGELLYLTAADLGLGITGLGGFDAAIWNELCGTTDDVLYLLAVGREDAGEKFDRMSSGGAHDQ